MDKPDDAALVARKPSKYSFLRVDDDKRKWCDEAAARIEQLVSERDAAVRDERERCAKIADGCHTNSAMLIARAIRAAAGSGTGSGNADD